MFIVLVKRGGIWRYMEKPMTTHETKPDLWICEKKTHLPEHDGATGYYYYEPVKPYTTEQPVPPMTTHEALKPCPQDNPTDIYLQPKCCDGGEYGRLWSTDPCSLTEGLDCDCKPVKYTRAASQPEVVTVDKMISQAYDAIQHWEGESQLEVLSIPLECALEGYIRSLSEKYPNGLIVKE